MPNVEAAMAAVLLTAKAQLYSSSWLNVATLLRSSKSAVRPAAMDSWNVNKA